MNLFEQPGKFDQGRQEISRLYCDAKELAELAGND